MFRWIKYQGAWKVAKLHGETYEIHGINYYFCLRKRDDDE